MKKTSAFIFHPYLFAIFPILSLYSHNKGEIMLPELCWPLLIVVVFTSALLWIMWVVFRDIMKAGIMTSLFMFLFFAYGHFRPVVVFIYRKIGILSIDAGTLQPGIIVLLLIACLLIVCFIILKRTKSRLHKLTTFLNLVSISLGCIVSIPIIAYEFQTGRLLRRNVKNHNMYEVEESSTIINRQPDIYYLIFDRYTSSNVLTEYFHFDNSEFLDSLKERGFYIAEESRANYLSTWRSLASSLNMVHINGMKDSLGERYTDMTILYDMVSNNEAAKFLKKKGYRYVLVGSVGGATRRGGIVDLCYNYSFGLALSDFNLQLVELSVLHPIIVKMLVGDARHFNRSRILFQFQKLAEIPSMSGQKFVFAHILVPHEPYIFDANGKLPSVSQLNNRSGKENYLNQLIYTNKKILELVDQILAKSTIAPIVVLQADEGAHAVGFPDNINLITHSHIFNAYHLTEKNKAVLYPSITPVNSFRIIFNAIFGTDYQMLEDKTYLHEGPDHPFLFLDVTERVL